MAKLKYLHRPLDVGESAAAQLGVRVGIRAAWQPLGVNACLDAPDLVDQFAWVGV